MPTNRVSGDLADALGKNINRLCPQRFHTASENHCAHFVCPHGRPTGWLSLPPDARRDLRRRAGLLRARAGDFPALPASRPLGRPARDEDDLLVFITSRNNVNLAAKTIRNVPQKHIGILRDGMIYHYSNGTDEVVRQSPASCATASARPMTTRPSISFSARCPAGRAGSCRGERARRGAKKDAHAGAPQGQALSLHIGLNEFDPGHYGEPGTLAGCENDARDMAELAKRQGFRQLPYRC